jgi:hypothetical protein
LAIPCGGSWRHPATSRLCPNAVIKDSGLFDPIQLGAGESLVERLPNETLSFLLGSRYCETDKFADIAAAKGIMAATADAAQQ